MLVCEAVLTAAPAHRATPCVILEFNLWKGVRSRSRVVLFLFHHASPKAVEKTVQKTRQPLFCLLIL